MGRPPGRVHDQPFQMRVSELFLRTIDNWRSKQEGEPSRAEAIRRLVELGLSVKSVKKPSPRAAARAAELAAETIDKHLDTKVPAEHRDTAKRRLIKGPSAFRNLRKDGR